MSDACQVGCGRVFRGADSMEKCERHEDSCDGNGSGKKASAAKATRRVRPAPPVSPVDAALRVLAAVRERLETPQSQAAFMLGVTQALAVADGLDAGHRGDLIARIEKEGL